MEGDILETRRQISESERHLDELKGTAPLNTTDILEAQEELAGYQRGLTALQALKEELF